MSRKAFIGDTLKYRKPRFKLYLKNDSAGEAHHSKPILNFSLPHKVFEGCLPRNLLQHLSKVIFNFPEKRE